MKRFTSPIKPVAGATIDWGNSITQDLIRAWFFNDGGSQTFVDSVMQDSATYARVNADTGYGMGDEGEVFKMGADGGNPGCPTVLTSGLGADSVSVACRFKVGSPNGFIARPPGLPSGTGDVLWGCRTSLTDVSPTLSYATTGFRFGADSAGIYSGAISTTTPDTNNFVTIVGTYARNVTGSDYQGTWTVYVNGIADGTNNDDVAGGFSGTFTDTLAVVGVASPTIGIGVGQSDKFMDWLYVWKRCLTPDEVMQLQINPFGFITPRRRIFKGSGSVVVPAFRPYSYIIN